MKRDGKGATLTGRIDKFGALGAAAALSGSVLGFAATAMAATGLSGCGAISESGAYRLTANLVTSEASCLRVTASNVSLDLAGRTITCTGSGFAGSCQAPGPGPTGIAVDAGLTGITIRGPGVVAGFDNGVSIVNSSATITGLTVTGPVCDEADCERPISNAIVVVGKLNPDGSVDLGQARVNIVGNTVRNHGRGIALLGAECGGSTPACAIYGNTAEHNTGLECNGILLSGASGYAVVGNQVHGNGSGECFPSVGIAVGDGSTGNLVATNDASSNVAVGIGVGPGTDGNRFVSNTARGNPFADLSALAGTVNDWSDSNRCIIERGAVPASVCNPGE